ncbi:MAG: tRNA-intron lyase [Candidatus Micrarchaeaceae archaeon]
MLQIEYISKNQLIVKDQSSIDLLKKGFFGSFENKVLKLNIFEVLYLIEVRNAICNKKGAELNFADLLSLFNNSKKFMAKYFTYKDWRDRGLVVKDISFFKENSNKVPIKEYPSSKLNLPQYHLEGTFFKSDLVSIINDDEKGKSFYENFWLGQYGSYKAPERGKLNKLDIYETYFLLEKNILNFSSFNQKKILSFAKSRRKDFLKLFEVYSDWREKGYIIKTGFKFGTHFRVYFPGAKPVKKEDKDWVHSKHVIHVFPKDSRLLISEWARAIRVAHSVRKTFILAVPGILQNKKIKPDFILYHRRGGEAESPDMFPPRYAMLSLSEEEYIGGKEFSGAIKEAKDKKLELILAITDRETAVTYYKVKKILLKGSKADYYEIDWMQP